MLEQITVHNFTELCNESIDDIVIKCKEDFTNKILKQMLDTNYKELKLNVHNYNTFNNLGRRITFNSKNIEYQETKYDIKEHFYNSILIISIWCLDAKSYDELRVPDNSSNISQQQEDKNVQEKSRWLLEEIKNTNLDIFEEDVIDNGLTITQSSFERWKSLFGLGEFPFLIIQIIRIGNKKYYFYTITR